MLALAVALVLPDLSKLMDVSQNAVSLFNLERRQTKVAFLSVARRFGRTRS